MNTKRISGTILTMAYKIPSSAIVYRYANTDKVSIPVNLRHQNEVRSVYHIS